MAILLYCSPLSSLEKKRGTKLELARDSMILPVPASDSAGVTGHKPGHALGFYMGAGIPVQVFMHVQQVFSPTQPSLQFYDKPL